MQMRSVAGDRCGVAHGCGVSGVFSSKTVITDSFTGQKKAQEERVAETHPSTWPQFLAVIIVNINMFALGSSTAWPAMALPQLLSADVRAVERPLTVDEASWLTATSSLAGFLAIPMFSILTAHIGRKTLCYVTITPILASWIIKMSSASVIALYVARVLAGVYGGGAFVVPPIYVSEIASDQLRGVLGSLLSALYNLGILFGYIVGAFVPYDVVLYVNIIPPVILIVSFAFMPETPYWLVRIGQNQQARKALRWLSRGATEEQVEWEMARIEMSLVACDGKEEPTVQYPGNHLCSRGALIGIAIVVVLCINQQFCGSFVVTSYTMFIFDAAGSSLSPEVSTIILGTLQVVAGLCSTSVIDRMGRRALLLLTNASVSLSIAVLGVYFYLKDETNVDISSLGWLPVTTLSVYMVMVAFGLGPLPYVMIAEVVAPRIRAVACIAGYSIIWGNGALMTKFYPLMSESMGAYGTFWFFAAGCVACTIIALSMMPETKNRPLEDILKELNGGNGGS